MEWLCHWDPLSWTLQLADDQVPSCSIMFHHSTFFFMSSAKPRNPSQYIPILGLWMFMVYILYIYICILIYYM
jgi:hypothetical protein